MFLTQTTDESNQVDSDDEEDAPTSLVEQHKAKMAEVKKKTKEEQLREEQEEMEAKEERLRKVTTYYHTDL